MQRYGVLHSKVLQGSETGRCVDNRVAMLPAHGPDLHSSGCKQSGQ